MSEGADVAEVIRKNFSPREHFERALTTAQRLLETQALWWRLSSSGVEPRLDAQRVDPEFKDDKEGRQVFERILNAEIVWALDMVALDESSLGAALRRILPSAKKGDLDPATLRDIQDRVAKVHAAFATPGFRQRAQIRRTCKGAALEEIRWDISVKKHDLSEGKIDDIPFATIELLFSNDQTTGGLPPAFRRMFDRPESVYFDCHVEDLDTVIRELETLRDNLRQLAVPALES
jgi:hypothetical protein